MRTENPPAGGASDARAARDRLSAARFAAAAAVLAIVGAVAIASMPAPRAPVPSAPGSSGALQLYYESGFPTPGEEPLERPVGVAVMADRVYVADSVAGVVRIFDERGVPRSIVGSGTLSVPTYVACDAARRQVFVTDRKTKALFVFDADGSDLRRLEVTGAPAPARGSTEATSWEPLGVAAGENGSIFVTDVSGRHALLLLDPSGRVRRAVGGAGDDAPVVVALEYPNDVAIVGPEVWLSDSNNGRVLVFDDAGAYLRAITVRGVVRGLAAIPGTDGAPAAVAGVDALAHDIVVWDLRGKEIGRFGGPGTTAGRLQYPNDVAISADGSRLFVADTGNRRVQIWRIEWADPGADGARQPTADASNRLPYVGAGALAFMGALACAVIAVSLWRRSAPGATTNGDDGPVLK